MFHWFFSSEFDSGESWISIHRPILIALWIWNPHWPTVFNQYLYISRFAPTQRFCRICGLWVRVHAYMCGVIVLISSWSISWNSVNNYMLKIHSLNHLKRYHLKLVVRHRRAYLFTIFFSLFIFLSFSFVSYSSSSHLNSYFRLSIAHSALWC